LGAFFLKGVSFFLCFAFKNWFKRKKFEERRVRHNYFITETVPIMSKVSYKDLATEAIGALKERTGSSLQAIKAYIAKNRPEVNLQAVSLHSFNEYLIQH
jgi:hypothetical protein